MEFQSHGNLVLEMPPPLGLAKVRKRKKATRNARVVAPVPPCPPTKTPRQLQDLILSKAMVGMGILLDLFCGVGRVAASAEKLGFPALGLDINGGWDLTDDCILHVPLMAIASGLIAAVCLGPPCSSWSRARRGKGGKKGWPRKLRSKTEIRGLTDAIFTAKATECAR